VVILGPVANLTPKISKEKLNSLRIVYPPPKEVKGSKDLSKEAKEKKKLKFTVGKFTQNGEVDITFNQKVNVPFNFNENQGSNKKGRLLEEGGVSLSEVNANDLFGVFVLQKSSENSKDLGYSISIKEWT